jgi:hypothetical protein
MSRKPPQPPTIRDINYVLQRSYLQDRPIGDALALVEAAIKEQERRYRREVWSHESWLVAEAALSSMGMDRYGWPVPALKSDFTRGLTTRQRDYAPPMPHNATVHQDADTPEFEANLREYAAALEAWKAEYLAYAEKCRAENKAKRQKKKT